MGADLPRTGVGLLLSINVNVSKSRVGRKTVSALFAYFCIVYKRDGHSNQLMKTNTLKFLAVYAAWVMLFALQKPCFMLWHHALMPTAGVGDVWQVMLHGLSLDLSVAGYFSVVPGLLILAETWYRGRVTRWIGRGYDALAALLFAVTFCLNLVLYGYWGFPLDVTPLFYFFSSPADAVASVSVWTVIVGCAIALLLAAGVFLLMQKVEHGFNGLSPNGGGKIGRSVLQLVLTGALLLPIRGGVGVSVMNVGEAYFSKDMRLNHAAVNPVFSLMESLSKQEDFASQYRFMDEGEAERVCRPLLYTRSDSTERLLTVQRPDIYIVILESFSREVMKTRAVPNMNRWAKEGVFFEHFYANSFRTDRGIVSILSGYPAQPTTSLMKYTRKVNHLPSIAGTLNRHGYGLKYYYGGDADFTNMRAYLTGMGFTDIVSDKDFPLKSRLSKWGVPDHLVFERLQNDLKGETGGPLLRVIQTSSSHEPFDVPFRRLGNKVLNAFAYTDDCVGRFVAFLKRTGRWKRSLVVLVPDHQGCYPEHLSEFSLAHYQIPMIWLGGAVKSPFTVENYGSQHDLAATLLGQMGIGHENFRFSKDMLDRKAPHFAFFTFPDLWGLATQERRMIYDNVSKKVMLDEGNGRHDLERQGKAYLQELYNDIAQR